MPQMAPYNWLIMFLIFNLIIMFIIVNNYFIYTPQHKINNMKINLNKFIWMW